ncbi:TRAP transporter small permease [Thermodesulfobacteriota bacterium]
MLLRKLGLIAWNIISWASRIAGIIATIAVMSIMVVTVADVLLRFIFNRPIPGSVELCEYFIIVGGFLGLAWCAIKGAHVKVDVISGLLSPRTINVSNLVNYLIGLSIVPLVAWRLFNHARIVQLQKTASSNLEIPAYPFYILAGIGFTLLGLVIIVFFIKSLVAFIKNENEIG